jgi:hypothetical protein
MGGVRREREQHISYRQTDERRGERAETKAFENRDRYEKYFIKKPFCLT